GFIRSFQLHATNNTINLAGIPFASPYIQAVQGSAGQFLLAGGFPNPPRGRPLPNELYQKLAEKNLVYYHWEITAERFPALLQLSQLSLMLTEHRQLQGDSAAFKWLRKINPALGNT